MDTEPITLGESLARGIRQVRAARGWSQAELAAASGLSRNLVSNLERGRSSGGADSDPQLSTLIRISEALGVSPSELLFPPDDPQQPVKFGSEVLESRAAWWRFAGFSAAAMEPMTKEYEEYLMKKSEMLISGMTDVGETLRELQRLAHELRGSTTDD
ncbi:helix-turn-helix domain-containing protein [Tsukamurella tyrosinosolvens]|uniref:helix-turn-helix domain-containing protein n=1 Tax=Tsukamurella tyrosinosolvens TaxID=57704 RepID=UPI003F49F45D